MAIYPEFIPPIKDYIKLITSRHFDKVCYGNGQPIADTLQELICTITDPIEIGGLGLSFKDPEDSDFDEISMCRLDDDSPPLLSEDGEYIGWYFDHEDFPNLEDIPPLEISLPSSRWEISNIKMRFQSSRYLSLDIFLNIDNNYYSVYLGEINN